jgi:hypothetical protein
MPRNQGYLRAKKHTKPRAEYKTHLTNVLVQPGCGVWLAWVAAMRDFERDSAVSETETKLFAA